MEMIKRLFELLFESLGLEDKYRDAKDWYLSFEPQQRRLGIAISMFSLAILISLTYLIFSGGGPDLPNSTWVYDTTAREIQVRSIADVDDDTVVVYKYACGDEDAFVGFFTRTVDGEKQVRTEDGEWVAMSSEEGRDIVYKLIKEKCPGDLARVYP